MATTVTNSTITSTITENIVLGGRNLSGQVTQRTTGIDEIYKKVLTIAAGSETIIAAGDASDRVHATSQHLINDRIEYIRITNLDDAAASSSYLQITINGSSDVAKFKLGGKESLILGNEFIEVVDSFSSFDSMVSITANSSSGTKDCEILICSKSGS